MQLIDIQILGCFLHEPNLMALALPRASFSSVVEHPNKLSEGHRFHACSENLDFLRWSMPVALTELYITLNYYTITQELVLIIFGSRRQRCKSSD